MVKPLTQKPQPYFDSLPERFRDGDEEALATFGKHLHWGYWADPSKADGTISDFVNAAEALSIRISNMAAIRDGMKVLDVGCGFGGTIANLNQRFSHLELVGVNINQEQLALARAEVQAQSTNSIEFIHGDACQLPETLKANYFNVVLAVECIFSFPSRDKFFQEAQRVLQPGGILAICDFLPIEILGAPWHFLERWITPLVGKAYGSQTIGAPLKLWTESEYSQLVGNTGFELVYVEDITPNTLPTYRIVNPMMQRAGNLDTYWATLGLELISRLGMMRYKLLSFRNRAE